MSVNDYMTRNYIDDVLKGYNHTREEIVCVLWGSGYDSIKIDALSLDVESFWNYAEATNWDPDVLVSGPHFPLALLSGKGWWIESTEYDSRTSLRFCEEPKAKPAKVCINENGGFYDKEDSK